VDALKNFAYSSVATPPSPATSGTTLTVTAGQGALFPAAPFDATVWPSGVQPLSTNAEIVRVTAVATDTLTITRAQYGTTAQSITAGYQIAQTIDANLLTQIATMGGDVSGTTNASTVAKLQGYSIYPGAPSNGNTLIYNSATGWTPASLTNVSTFSAGTTGLTPSSATSGSVTLAGTLAASNGGTGLTSVGTSGNVLTSNGTTWTSTAPVAAPGATLPTAAAAWNGTTVANITPVTNNAFITANYNSIPTATLTELAFLSLPAGTWLVMGRGQFTYTTATLVGLDLLIYNLSTSAYIAAGTVDVGQIAGGDARVGVNVEYVVTLATASYIALGAYPVYSSGSVNIINGSTELNIPATGLTAVRIA